MHIPKRLKSSLTWAAPLAALVLLSAGPAPAQETAGADTASSDVAELETIRVTAKRNARRHSDYVARMPLKNLENPQSYTVINKGLLDEQVVTDYQSALKNVAGAGSPLHTASGRVLFFSRGFNTESHIRNGMVSWTYSGIDPVNLERIEAIRGPSGVIFGGPVLSYGGLYNRVTKRPYEEFGGEVSFSGGSWNLARTAADVNIPLDEDKTTLLRVNTAVQEEHSFQDAGYFKSFAFTPSLVHYVNDRLSLLLDVEWYDREGAGGTNGIDIDTGVTLTSMDQLGMDPEKSFSDNSLKSEYPTLNVNAQVNYEFLPGWTSRSQYARSRFTNNQTNVNRFTLDNDSLAYRRIIESDWTRSSHQLQQDFLGDFRIGPVRNRLLVGVSYIAENEWSADRYGSLDSAVNVRNPHSGGYTQAHYATAKEALGPAWIYDRETSTYSGYISNVINPIAPLSLHLGLRFDRFNDGAWRNLETDIADGAYEQDAWSPKAGVVYEVLANRLSVFANYMNGFRNIFGTSKAGETFKPEQANQWEGGVKADAFAGRLAGTISIYHITVDDKLRTDPTDPDFDIQDGRQTSKGVDLELAAYPIRGLDITGGYAWNRSRLDKADSAVDGRRPAYSGAEHAANLWTSYRLLDGVARGLGAGMGANYMGEQYMVNTNTQQFTAPAYTSFDATIFYDRPSYRLALKVNNLTDELYWNGWGSPQPPRHFVANMTYKF